MVAKKRRLEIAKARQFANVLVQPLDCTLLASLEQSKTMTMTNNQSILSPDANSSSSQTPDYPYAEFLNREHEDVREMVRDFAAKEIAPKAAEVDREHRFPAETFTLLGKLDLLGIPIATEYGGAGLDYRSNLMAIEEIGRACGSTGLSYLAHTSLGTMPIYLFGTQEQKRKYLPKLSSGEFLGCWALTEPGTGSDAAAQKTTAVADGDCWVLNGSKQFITNASVAKTAVVMAMTDRSLGQKGISSFIVETDTEGFHVSKIERKMGTRGSPTCSITFDNCRVPKENLIGNVGEGYKQALITLEGGRIMASGVILGMAQAAFDAALSYAKQREAFGQAIGKFQFIQGYLADMATELSAARMLIYHAACLKDKGKRVTMEGSQAKLFTAQMAMRVCNLALQIHGGYGYVEDFPVERFLRDAKLGEIGEGTN
jgi:alkylation response protein AidB-like acyl-CoA dehydrogenase